MQTLLEEGTLPYSTVQVRLYSQLSREMVLSLGYAHNTVTHERNKIVSFIDKVRLMRDLLPPNPDKEAILVWKNALALIFKKKDPRKLQQAFAIHLQMARLPEPTWSFIVSTTTKMNVTQRFFVDSMKLKLEFAEEAFLTLTKGEKAFKMEVKKMLADQSKLKKPSKEGTIRTTKNTAKQKEPENNENCVLVTEDHVSSEVESYAEAEMEEDYNSQMICLKRELEQLNAENERLVKENSKLKDELVAVKEKSTYKCESASQKRKLSSPVTDAVANKIQKLEGFVEKQVVWAYYKETDLSYPAQILTVGRELIEVEWLEDGKIRKLPLKHVKRVDPVKEKGIRREFKNKLSK
ncbi:uncharacterized protein LOC132749279 [Ruditapes philippinarum]|uniref:uncharacterized protein LOC132749279 n=1 Tax=Ruditapes philippinarum TaxID=129788 RepID=UPI00295B6615|nr:uncharacterized protein LOC132749279 [Ruditapes philippinarum]